MSEEIWKDIPGYEGLYKVSNFGRVKSLARMRRGNGNSICPVNEKVLRGKIDKYGYSAYALCKNAQMKHFTAHRLVADAFKPNPNPSEFNQINHIDGNKLNNTPENLEWCSAYHNTQEALRLGLRGGGKPYKPRVDSTPINQYDRNGNFIRRFENLAEAVRVSGILKSAICNCLNGRSKSSGGYVWEFATKKPA